MEIKEGAVVQLKSGGPDMTVASIQAGSGVVCAWFNQEGGVWTAQQFSFKANMLKAVNHQDED